MRGINQDKMRMFYDRAQITSYQTFAVSDAIEDEYITNLFEAAKVLDQLLNDDEQEVFLHCTTGISRSPTLVIVYLALFLRHKNWDNLTELEAFVKKAFPQAVPNMVVAKKCIEKNRDFQAKQRKRYEKELRNKKEGKDEAERQRLLRLAQEEAERLRLRRLAEQDDEEAMLAKIRAEEEERLRKLRAQNEEAERLLRMSGESDADRLARLRAEQEKDRLRLQKMYDDDAAKRAERDRLRRECEQ